MKKRPSVVNRFCYLILFMSFLFMFSACRSPVGETISNPEQTAPLGKGSLTLTLAGVGRTVLPAALHKEDFLGGYTLVFYTAGTEDLEETVNRTNENFAEPVNLPNGTYDLVVTAWLDTAMTRAGACARLEGIVIGSAASVTRSVYLKAIIADGVTGIFTWDITLPAGLTTANMNIAPLNGSVITDIDILTENTGSRDLPTGYYRLIFTLEKPDTQPIIHREILHIYQNLKSIFNDLVFEFTDEYFGNIKYTITWTFNDVSTPNTDTNCLHGGKITDPVPARTGYIFNGWYTNEAFTNVWDFDVPLTGDLALYAKWTAVAVEPNTITAVDIIIAEPAKGEVPATTAAGTGDFTVGLVSWYPADNPFLGGSVYTVTITITADEDYEFAEGITATVNGYPADVNASGTEATVSHTFAATPLKAVTGITIKTQPTNVTYTHGDTLNLSGLVVMLEYDDATTEDVASADFEHYNIYTNPDIATHLSHSTHNNQPVMVEYGSLVSANTGNLTVGKANCAFLAYTAMSITYNDGLTLGSLTLSADYAWVTPSTILNAGNGQPHNATYTDPSGNYNPVNGTITVNVSKATPTVSTWPSSGSVTYGTALSASALTGGAASVAGSFGWANGAAIPTVTNTGYEVTFTPDDIANYNTVTGTVAITVGKATPAYTAPTGLTATYGQTLANVTLPTGFIWEAATATPVGNAGTNNFDVTFMPSDTANYNTVSGISVAIAVGKATPAYTAPTGLTATYGQTLANVTLPTGFAWEVAATTSVGNAGTKNFYVTFAPADQDNYNTVPGISVAIAVSKATPAYTAPTGLTATSGQTLANVTLPSDFTWDAATTTSVGSIGTNNFSVTFTPADQDNYNTVPGISVAITVSGTRPININFGQITGDPLTWTGGTEPIIISRNGNGGYAATLELVLEDSDQYDDFLANGIKWLLSPQTGVPALDVQTGDTFTFTSPDSLDYTGTDTYTLTLQVKKGGAPYNRTIQFKVIQ